MYHKANARSATRIARTRSRSTGRPRRNQLTIRERPIEALLGPVLDIALQHAVLEVLLLEHRLGDVAEGNHADQLVAVHHRKVAGPGVDRSEEHTSELQSR